MVKDPEIAAIEKAMKADPKIKEFLGILLDLIKVCGKYRGGGRRSGSLIEANHLTEGFPLADARFLPSDTEQLEEHFSRVVSVLLKKDPKKADGTIRYYTEGNAFHGLLSGVLAQDYKFPGTFTGSEPVTLLAANETLLCLLAPVRDEAVEKNLIASWTAPYCPVCGASPHFSLIEGEAGNLFLSCSRCFTRWKYRRMACPFCGESEQKKARYFTTEGDTVHRVYVCETCKHYLKSVDSRDKGTVFPRVEDLATIRLDLVSRREGYVRDTVDLVTVLTMGD
jgi:FdhE protein